MKEKRNYPNGKAKLRMFVEKECFLVLVIQEEHHFSIQRYVDVYQRTISIVQSFPKRNTYKKDVRNKTI